MIDLETGKGSTRARFRKGEKFIQEFKNKKQYESLVYLNHESASQGSIKSIKSIERSIKVSLPSYDKEKHRQGTIYREEMR